MKKIILSTVASSVLLFGGTYSDMGTDYSNAMVHEHTEEPALEALETVNMILGFILMFGIAMILCVGCWLANGTQDFIDEQNERLRKDEKWRDRNNG